MPGNTYPPNAIEQAQSVLNAWSLIDGEVSFGDLTMQTLTDQIAQVGQSTSQIDNLETQLTNLRNQRDAQILTLWDIVKRVRAAVKGIYGDDSSQYEMVGGTRLSERKTPTRKTTAAA
jgi:hypothetical protein